MQRVERGAVPLFARPSQLAVEHRQLDVLHGGSAGEEIEALEDEADLGVANHRALVAVEGRDVDAVEVVGAGGRAVEASQDVHQRRLAGAGRSHDGHELAGLDVEVDAGERAHFHLAHLVDLGQIVNLDDRLRH